VRYLALLRGVNLAGKNKVSMAELRGLVESLGYSEVTTFIQSGNVIFRSGEPVTSDRLEAAIHSKFGIAVTVVLRTPSELRRTVAANPFSQDELSKLHVGFMARKPSPSVVVSLDAERFRPEQFVVRGTELYLYLPNGMGHTKLPAYLERQLKVLTTIRNWNTVTKLAELLSA